MEDTAKCQISIEKVTALIATWGLFFWIQNLRQPHKMDMDQIMIL